MKKSLYVFLCSILGILIFLVIHRLILIVYFLIAAAYPQAFYGNMENLEFIAADFITLFLVLIFGSWYGIWLGLKWYESVYENAEYTGFVDYLIRAYWPSAKKDYNLQQKVQSVVNELGDDVLELKHLAKTIKPVLREVKPIKRSVNRKRLTVKNSKAV